MPYASKAQQRLFHAKAARGEISEDTVHEWDEATKRKKGGFKGLPEKKAYLLGAVRAVGDLGLEKEAFIQPLMAAARPLAARAGAWAANAVGPRVTGLVSSLAKSPTARGIAGDALVQGGMAAATAPPGESLKAGFNGAVMGGLTGGASRAAGRIFGAGGPTPTQAPAPGTMAPHINS